jgi:hypothetical protein
MVEIDDIMKAINEANNLQKRVDYNSKNMARLLIGRLRNIDSNYILSALKRELKDYNAKTGKWT